jgi:hypothetical protein
MSLADPVDAPAYVSPYGQLPGLAERLEQWARRMGTDRTLPWAGLGIIGDLKLAASILNLREFAEYVRTNGAPEHRLWADDILRLDETADATQSALCRAGLTNYDPPAGVESVPGAAIAGRNGRARRGRQRDAHARPVAGVAVVTALPRPRVWTDGHVPLEGPCFRAPDGQIFALVACHTSTVPIGRPVQRRIGCAGCRP